MKVTCIGNRHHKCDATCVHATSHDAHPKGCMCEDCNVDNDPDGGIGCVNYDKCVETGEIVRCQ